MPTECNADSFGFAPVEGREVVAALDGGSIISDAGPLLLGAADRCDFYDGSVCRVLSRHAVPSSVRQNQRRLRSLRLSSATTLRRLGGSAMRLGSFSAIPYSRSRRSISAQT